MAAGLGIDAVGVREGLRQAMRAGLPVDGEQWPRFALISQLVDSESDEIGVPWDPAVAPTLTPTYVRPLCALEWGEEAPKSGRVRTEPLTLTITMLDEEWESVKGFSYVEVWPAGSDAPARLWYVKVAARYALDTVEVYSVLVSAEDTQ